jgi:hypothetical protein
LERNDSDCSIKATLVNSAPARHGNQRGAATSHLRVSGAFLLRCGTMHQMNVFVRHRHFLEQFRQHQANGYEKLSAKQAIVGVPDKVSVLMSFVREVLNRTHLKNKLFRYRAPSRLQRTPRVPPPQFMQVPRETKSLTHFLVVITSKSLSFALLSLHHGSLPTLD